MDLGCQKSHPHLFLFFFFCFGRLRKVEKSALNAQRSLQRIYMNTSGHKNSKQLIEIKVKSFIFSNTFLAYICSLNYFKNISNNFLGM